MFSFKQTKECPYAMDANAKGSPILNPGDVFRNRLVYPPAELFLAADAPFVSYSSPRRRDTCRKGNPDRELGSPCFSSSSRVVPSVAFRLPDIFPYLCFLRSGSFLRSYISWAGRLPKFIASICLPRSALIEYKGFDGACVTVEVSGFRVSGGPSLIFEITQVKDFPLDDSPNGVSAVVGAADVVPFLTDELKVPRRIDLTGLG